MVSPCAAESTHFADNCGKPDASKRENSLCGSTNKLNRKKVYLCCRKQPVCRCRKQSLICRLHRQLNRNWQSSCRKKNPASRQSGTPPGIAGCWLQHFAGEFGCRRIAGGMRCPAGRAAAVLSGGMAKAVCTGQPAGRCTAFRHGVPDPRPCGQPVLLLGLSALGPVMIFSSMMLYGLGSGLLMVQLCAVGGWKRYCWRCCGQACRRRQQAAVCAFRSFCLTGQQPYPCLFLPQASRRTSPPRGAGADGPVSADHGNITAAVRCGGGAFVYGKPPVNRILFLRVLAQCVTIAKDHNK